MRFKCKKCGELRYALFDGYIAGETLLEGVYFEIREKNGEPDVKVAKESRESFEQFNKKYWINTIKETLPEIDSLLCPKCKGEIPNPFYEKPKKVLKPKSVKLISWKDLLEKIKKIGFEVIVFFLSFTMLMLELAVLIYLEMGG